MKDILHHNKGFLQTPSQTVGPYFAYGLTPEQYLYDFKQLVANNIYTGEDAITIKGKVFDGNGTVIPDALIEIWDHQTMQFGRFGTGTTKDNSFEFSIKKPIAEGNIAPFVTVIVSMRGQLIHSYTRLYFSDEIVLNTQDEVLTQIEVSRQHTLVAIKKGNHYLFDIHMQGQNETVFFDL